MSSYPSAANLKSRPHTRARPSEHGQGGSGRSHRTSIPDKSLSFHERSTSKRIATKLKSLDHRLGSFLYRVSRKIEKFRSLSTESGSRLERRTRQGGRSRLQSAEGGRRDDSRSQDRQRGFLKHGRSQSAERSSELRHPWEGGGAQTEFSRKPTARTPRSPHRSTTSNNESIDVSRGSEGARFRRRMGIEEPPDHSPLPLSSAPSGRPSNKATSGQNYSAWRKLHVPSFGLQPPTSLDPELDRHVRDSPPTHHDDNATHDQGQTHGQGGNGRRNDLGSAKVPIRRRTVGQGGPSGLSVSPLIWDSMQSTVRGRKTRR